MSKKGITKSSSVARLDTVISELEDTAKNFPRLGAAIEKVAELIGKIDGSANNIKQLQTTASKTVDNIRESSEANREIRESLRKMLESSEKSSQGLKAEYLAKSAETKESIASINTQIYDRFSTLDASIGEVRKQVELLDSQTTKKLDELSALLEEQVQASKRQWQLNIGSVGFLAALIALIALFT
ncbi:MAG: hypothetical protein FWE48_02195 [Coriobacteriia bacterium]|nr:hypothetical protein [Coriobacteriia bacterium]